MSNTKKEIYLIFIPELNVSKIGVAKKSKKRLKQLQTGCPYKIELRKVYESDIPYKTEKILHRQFSSKKIDQQDYNLVGEWFQLDIDQIIDFEIICKKIEENIFLLKKQNNPFLF